MKALDFKDGEESHLGGQVNQSFRIEQEPSQSFAATSVTLETEIPEALYTEMNEFISSHPRWDQYSLMSSALANFLFQNGCGDRAVTERYLADLFRRSDS